MEATLHETPANPAPANHTVGFFTAHDGVKLRYAVFRSEISPARGTVVLLHGRNECIEKYFETIRDLNAMGMWVATYDMRGQGGSQRLVRNGLKGHVRRFADYERDLFTFLDAVVLPDTRLPFFLLAHSTGALVALSAAPRLESRIERMVLSAPLVGIARVKMSIGTMRRLSKLFCLVGLGGLQVGRGTIKFGFEDNPLTADAKRFARNESLLEDFPHLMVGLPTARWLRESLCAIRRCLDPDHLASIRIPTLILAPMRDGVIPYIDQENLSRHFRAAQLIPVPGARHELFQEKDVHRVQALAAIAAFIPGSDAEKAEVALTME
ncbi:MAG: lysophospholipase [Rhizobiales bacterium 63-7]|nr:alpha/beta hydrolase [Hyphomicrobiales bacterium]OJU67330.1 MAG: lysophospholipase [Rhizobiales bacterium 63-7]